MTDNNASNKEKISELLKKYKENRQLNNLSINESDNNLTNPPIANDNASKVNSYQIPKSNYYSPNDIQNIMNKEIDPDLMTTYEIVKLPSMGLFYSNKLSEVAVEYMTSKDEDMLTTPSLIENGTVLDVLLKRKIKTQGVNPDDLLPGDRNAIILFLRSSSYGREYTVQVIDPRTNTPFKTVVDLTKLKYKEIKEFPDENGLFSVMLPMRKKEVKFKLLTAGEENILFKKAKSIQEAYNEEYNQYSTMKLKASIFSINGNSDRLYIDKFVDAMPALDAYAIRKKINDVSPDVDLEYEFTTKDNYTFNANLVIGLDFFFPKI